MKRKICPKSQEQKKKREQVNWDSSESEYEPWQESGSSLDDISDECFSNSNENEPLMDESKLSSSDESENEPLVNVAKKTEARHFSGWFLFGCLSRKKKIYHNYICSVQKIYDISEVEVQAFSPLEQSKSYFKVIENDISVVNVNAEQLVRKLEKPSMVTTGNRIRYVFHGCYLNIVKKKHCWKCMNNLNILLKKMFFFTFLCDNKFIF